MRLRRLGLKATSLGSSCLLLGGCAQLLGLTEDYHEVTPSDDGSSLGGNPPVGGTSNASGGASASTGGAATSGGSSSGGAVPLPPLEDFELPAGKLVYHRFTNAAAGDSEMFVVDLPAGTLSAELGVTYQLCNPVDGSFSPDGTKLAVAAQPWAVPCPVANDQDQEIYLLDLQTPGTKTTVTTNISVPDNDPKFSNDGSFIAFNRGGHLAEWRVGNPLLSTCPPAAGSFCYGASGAQTKPALSEDNGTICYQELDLADADVFCVDRAEYQAGAPLNPGDQDGVAPIRVPAVQRSYVYDAHPLIFDGYLYFQRWVSESNKKKLIARKDFANLSGKETKAAFCTDEGSSYRDVANLGDDYLIFSSDVNGTGPTDLFLGNFQGSELLSLDEWIPALNSPDKYEYGASFWAAP